MRNVTNEDIDLNGVDLCICEVTGIIDVVLFIHQEAEPAQRDGLNDATLTLLHVGDRTIAESQHETRRREGRRVKSHVGRGTAFLPSQVLPTFSGPYHLSV
jgi:hypothetical protein